MFTHKLIGLKKIIKKKTFAHSINRRLSQNQIVKTSMATGFVPTVVEEEEGASQLVNAAGRVSNNSLLRVARTLSGC